MSALHRLFGSAPRPSSSSTPRSSDADKPDSNDGNPKDPVTSLAAAHKMGDAQDLIGKREEHLARLIENEVASAREHGAAGRQKAALTCLKKKRILEKELESLAANKLNLFQSEHTLHALKFHSLVVDAQQEGMQAITREMKKVGGVDGVEKVQDKLEDLMADAGDVLSAGNRTMGDVADMDDDELLEELEAMELADLTAQLKRTDVGGNASGASSSSGAAYEFAEVPRGEPVTAASRARAKQKEKEEEERQLLAELQATMAVPRMEAAGMPMPMKGAWQELGQEEAMKEGPMSNPTSPRTVVACP